MIEKCMTDERIVSMDEALAALGVTDQTLSAEERESIETNGYVILRDMIDPAWLAQLRETYERLMYEKYGEWKPELTGGATTDMWSHEIGTRRIAELVSEGEAFDRSYVHPRLLAAVRCILGPEFRLHSLNSRDALPGQGHQALHVDGSPRKPVEPFHTVNSAWLLDDFTVENGATRVIPGTHTIPGPVSDHVTDCSAPHPRQQIITAPAGSVFVFNAYVWHSGTQNRTRKRRRAFHCAFTTAAVPQRDRQSERIRKSVYERISPAARFILGV